MDIFSDRLVLSKITQKDLADIHFMNTHPEVAEYNTIGIPESINDTERVLTAALNSKQGQLPTKLGWSIRLKDNNQFLGELGMSLSTSKYNKSEIHYSLLPSEWGKGYASEAVSTIIKWGFEQVKLHRIEAGVATENSRSIKLLEKVGMKREGLCRQILPIRGEWKDNYMYAILDVDYF
jgi:RimJ/RimL family protein N-acetyltransferase